jgi:NAD(P)-dependent dehydrogenase (short-subunit alcohol dehydrogenase family)
VALITGGTRGLGLAIAERFAQLGALPLLAGRSREPGEAAAARLGGQFLLLDVTDPGAPARLHEAIAQQHGRLDVLVNNAGDLGKPQNVAGTEPDALMATLSVHLGGPWMLMRALFPLMPEGASIINMASVAGHRVGASSAAYSVAKAAMIHLTRCAAAEFGARGVRVNSVSPGFIPTDIHAQALGSEDPRGAQFVFGLARLFRQRQALDRTGAPGDVANLVAFLASDAAAFVSGSDFVADGGMMWGRAGLL